MTEPGTTTAPAAEWVKMNRPRMIATFREWADRQMAIHDNKASGLAQSLRDAAFYRADALFEVAQTIEDGEFDPVRPMGATASTTPETGREEE